VAAGTFSSLKGSDRGEKVKSVWQLLANIGDGVDVQSCDTSVCSRHLDAWPVGSIGDGECSIEK